MGLFNRKKKEEANNVDQKLVPLLFGELNDDQLCAKFPEITSAIKNKQNDAIREFLLPRANTGESRLQIAVWNKLRSLSVTPEVSIAKKVLAFVAEVNMGKDKGVDYLAAYSDNSARYFNYSGKKIFYETPFNQEINNAIQKLLSFCVPLVNTIGVWEEPRRGAPDKNAYGLIARLNCLTPSGLMFGEATVEDFLKSPLSKNIMAQSTVVMKLLIGLDK